MAASTPGVVAVAPIAQCAAGHLLGLHHGFAVLIAAAENQDRVGVGAHFLFPGGEILRRDAVGIERVQHGGLRQGLFHGLGHPTSGLGQRSRLGGALADDHFAGGVRAQSGGCDGLFRDLPAEFGRVDADIGLDGGTGGRRGLQRNGIAVGLGHGVGEGASPQWSRFRRDRQPVDAAAEEVVDLGNGRGRVEGRWRADIKDDTSLLRGRVAAGLDLGGER